MYMCTHWRKATRHVGVKLLNDKGANDICILALSRHVFERLLCVMFARCEPK